MADQTMIRRMHAGKTGDADALLLKHDVIGVGWTKLGDLSKLKTDRETAAAAARMLGVSRSTLKRWRRVVQKSSAIDDPFSPSLMRAGDGREGGSSNVCFRTRMS
jgi:hypothetical protein